MRVRRGERRLWSRRTLGLVSEVGWETPALTPRDWTDHAFAVAIACAIAAFVFVGWCALATGCVTRTTVCLETAHGVGRVSPADVGGRRDSLGGSVCADIERP